MGTPPGRRFGKHSLNDLPQPRLRDLLRELDLQLASSPISTSSLKSTFVGHCTVKRRPPRLNSTSLCRASASRGAPSGRPPAHTTQPLLLGDFHEVHADLVGVDLLPTNHARAPVTAAISGHRSSYGQQRRSIEVHEIQTGARWASRPGAQKLFVAAAPNTLSGAMRS